jgi:hypothetical protein
MALQTEEIAAASRLKTGEPAPGWLGAVGRRLVANELEYEAARCRRVAQHHAELEEKYRVAASSPWARVEPDPFAPD